MPVLSPWKQHLATWRNCQACDLCEQRNKIVLARGDIPCHILFLGEAPGDSEDSIGQPFKGPAGHLLDDIISKTNIPVLQLKTAFTNLVGCFPREAKREGHNEPSASQILACRGRLLDFIGIAKPLICIAVGKLSEKYMPEEVAMSGIKTIEIIHPAAILRMPMAQKSFAARKCIVQIDNIIEQLAEN